MPIEIIDKLKPKGNGSFAVADAKDIAVTDTARLTDVLETKADKDDLQAGSVSYSAEWATTKTVEGALNKLYETLTGVPTLQYVSEEDSEKSFDLGKPITFQIKTSSAVSNSITIVVEEEQNGVYRVIKKQSDTAGINEIDIGSSSEVKKARYRISITDIRGSQGTVVNSDGTPIEPKTSYLTFTYTIGGVQLSTNISQVVTSSTFTSGWNTIELQYDLKYAVGDSPKLLLQCDSDTTSGVVVNTEMSLSGASNFLEIDAVSGKGHFLTVYVYLPSDTSYSFSVRAKTTEGGSDYYSDTQTCNIMALNINSIYTNVTRVRPSNPTTRSTISFDVNVNSTVSYITDSYNMELICVFKQSGKDDIVMRRGGVRKNTNIVWNAGIIESEGSWDYTIYVQPTDESVTSIPYEGTINVTPYSGLDNIEYNGLLAYFDASSVPVNRDVWENKITENPEKAVYRIDLHNLTHSTSRNGWVVNPDTGESYLKLSAGTYGLLYKNNNLYKPFGTDLYADRTNQKDYTLEFKYKSNCSGDYDAVSVCCGATNSTVSGINASFRNISHSVKGVKTDLNTAEDVWIHACVVFRHSALTDEDIKATSDYDEADFNPGPSVKVYLNGVLSKYTVLPSFSDNDIYSEPSCLPFCLNGVYDIENNTVSRTGDSYIQFIRIYNKALTTNQIIGNYISSITDSAEQTLVQNRNESSQTTIPSVYFLRQATENNTNTFEELHKITKKKLEDGDDPSLPTSKSYAVPCKVLYNKEGSLTTYDNVLVYLQGTSSLLYPVKNYQLKFYSDKAFSSKSKIIPPDATWVEPSYVYTLKCDYMDQSHKNNTPTARYYDTVLSNVITSESEYSPAKRTTTIVGDSTVRRYRDTIDGFPILVYYCDVDLSTKDTSQEDLEFARTNSYYAGTYMFNVDKEGDQLGFSIDLKDIQPESLSNDVSSYIDNNKANIWKYAGSVDDKTFNVDSKVTLDDVSPVSYLPCVSYEGASNAQISAGTFFTLDEYNKYIEENSEITDAEGNVIRLGSYDNWSDYINATLEPRYTYSEDYEDESFYNDITFGHMRRAIEWVSSNYKPYDKDTGPLELADDITLDDIKKEFPKYFSVPYCLTYYLQMMFFTQIDNAGKNAMFDVWYDGVIYPRPYDMDSQMGETNTGEDKVQVSAELPGLTPRQYNNTTSSNMSADTMHTRFTEYNTSTNRLWNLFAKAFSAEISKKYRELRSSVYTVDNVVTSVNSDTTDVIGEYFYNKDASYKYLRLKTEDGEFDTQHLPKLQGSRNVRYSEYLKQRIIFLDSYFNYSGAGSLNTNLTGRSDANNEGYSTVTLGLSCYSPQYFRLNIGSGDGTATVYVDPNLTCTVDGEQLNGVTVTLPTIGGNKELEIRGVGNLKSMFNIESLYLSELQASNATKLLECNLSGSPRLTTLSVGYNKYLRSVDVSNSTNLSGTLDLSNCENLESVNISNTNVTSLILPRDSILKYVNCDNTSLINLSFENQPFLTFDNIHIDNCKYLASIEFKNCSSVTKLDLSDITSLTSVRIENCKELTEVLLTSLTLNTLVLTDCDKLSYVNLSGCRGTAFRSLNLAGLQESLTTLNISSITSTDGSTLRALIPTSIEKLYIANSQFKQITCKNINYETEAYDYFDFEELSLSDLTLNSNTSLTCVKNLEYEGSLYGFFNGCSSLVELESVRLTPSTDSISTLFKGCSSLTTFNSEDVLQHPEMITIGSACFRECSALSYDKAKEFISRLSRLTNANEICYNALKITEGTTHKTFEIGPDLFHKDAPVESINYGFNTCYVTAIRGLPTTLKSAQFAFSSCADLEYIEVSDGTDLLSSLVNLEYSASMFNNCNKLKLSSNFKLPGNIKNTACMFLYCNNLYCHNADLDLSSVFENASKLTDARAMFYKCANLTITGLENVFSACTNLQYIDYMFAHCSSISCDIACLSSNYLEKLESAAGLFYGCRNITGSIPIDFFLNIRKLKYIGLKFDSKNRAADYSFSTGGMFSNTGITSFHKEFLYPLSELIDASFLFFQGTGGGEQYITSNTTPPGYTPNKNEGVGLSGYFVDADDTIYEGIPVDMFVNNTKLKNVAYMFAGNTNLSNVYDENNQEIDFENIQEGESL